MSDIAVIVGLGYGGMLLARGQSDQTLGLLDWTRMRRLWLALKPDAPISTT
jgi:hypothetical protein